MDVDTIISIVALEYNLTTNMYTLESEDADALNQFLNDQR